MVALRGELKEMQFSFWNSYNIVPNFLESAFVLFWVNSVFTATVCTCIYDFLLTLIF